MGGHRFNGRCISEMVLLASVWGNIHLCLLCVFMEVQGAVLCPYICVSYPQEKFMSLEKEVFPFMAKDGQLFSFDLSGK